MILILKIELKRNKRGNSYVIYKYLYCDCGTFDFLGSVCQIDYYSIKRLIAVYKQLYQKVLNAQTTQYDFNLLNTVHLLIKSGAANQLIICYKQLNI